MTWHILKKDLRRLHWPIALTNALLLALTVLDIWRYDYEAGLAETILNLIVPLAWGVLIASAVQLEPLTADTAFWLTRPYRRPALLGAKVLFAVLAIHATVLISHAVILSFHGFAPFAMELLWKQAVIFVAITVPSLAIASLTSSLAGFGWCALSAGAVAVLMDAALQGRRFPWIRADWVPEALALLLLAAGGVAIIALQYARRTRWTGRAIGLCMALGAVLTYSFVPRDFTAALQCSLAPDLTKVVSVRYEAGLQVVPQVTMNHPDRMNLSIPVKVEGLDHASRVMVEQLSLRVSAPDGRTWQTRREVGLDRRAFLAFNLEKHASAQSLMPDRSFVRDTSSVPVRIDGRASIRPIRLEEPVRLLPWRFDQTDVPGVGRCSTTLTVVFFAQEALKVTCESPADLPMTTVTLVDPQNGREWKQMLGNAGNPQLVPEINWLSPLQRRQTFFQVVDKATQPKPYPGDQWLVPSDVLRRTGIRFRAGVEEGCANVEYSFEVANLASWEVQSSRP